MSYKPTRFVKDHSGDSGAKSAAKLPAPRRTIAVLLTAAFLGVFGLPPAAGAEIISPDVGLQATLDAVNVSIYYHPTNAGYHVVVTTGTEDSHSVVRFVSTLAPGQDAVVSVPRGVGQRALQLRLHRVGDRVELQHPVS
jgi:hypothetical protein